MSICSQFYLVYSIFFAISCVKTNKLPFCQIISIYALLAEGDLLEGYGNDNPGAFQSTPSSRRATVDCPASFWSADISIHALLTEGDLIVLWHIIIIKRHFNPRPPHGGRLQPILTSWFYFRYFNPRPPHGGRPSNSFSPYLNFKISIHALLTEGDRARLFEECQAIISIHALLTEGDSRLHFTILQRDYFNPRPPHGGRLGMRVSLVAYAGFQSTPSSRRATFFHAFPPFKALRFQSTPSSRRATSIKDPVSSFTVLFQSTPSSRRAT